MPVIQPHLTELKAGLQNELILAGLYLVPKHTYLVQCSLIGSIPQVRVCLKAQLLVAIPSDSSCSLFKNYCEDFGIVHPKLGIPTSHCS